MPDHRLAGAGEDPSDVAASLSVVERMLFERRVVLVTGQLDHGLAGRVAASLLALAALADDPIELRISAASDSLDVAVSLMDTIDSLGVPVNATVAGSVEGTAVGVLVACRRRRIGEMARIQLNEPQAEFSGVAADLRRQADDLQARLETFVRRLAQATGRPFEHVEADLRTGRHLDAKAALAYGLVDEIATPGRS